jgi:vancomycin resistance protein YoaR
MSSGTLELQPETVEPEVHILDLQKHYMLRSSVYTPISTSSEENRNNNIRRAFEFINGYVLQPGDQFSFNSVVGQRTEENGFFPAIEYAYGEHVMGIGGGVCQASTTLYQAAVCAGLQIVKRQPHSDAVSYTEYGKDATVYWVGKRKIDLVFRNSSEDPIYMVASVLQDPSNKRRLIAKVMMYGADMGDVRYEIETKTVQEIDPPENPVYVKDKEGTYVTYTDQQKSVSKAKPGYVVESYRVKYAGNTETERTILYTDTYDPKPERIYVGVNRRGD